MILYLVHGFIRTASTYETFSYWVDSYAAAETKEKEINSRRDVLKTSVAINAVKVPTDKAGMLKFLNEGQYI